MKILIGGDYFPNWIKDITPEQYRHIFDEMADLINDADCAILNYESPVATNDDIPIEKDGPGLRSRIEAMKAVKDAGFDVITLANNHTLDFGEKALINTINMAEKIGLSHVGAGKDITEAEHPLYKSINGSMLAIINCCEHEFSIAGHQSGGTSPLNPVRMYYTIKEARRNADHVIVITHGGHEYYQLPSPRMQQLYRYFIDLGSDAVVNHHQHCYSGYEIYGGKPIVYGLGNLFFPSMNIKDKEWNEGYMVMINLIDDKADLTLHPYKQSVKDLKIKNMDNRKEFDSSINKLNCIISDSKELCRSHRAWMKSKDNVYGVLLAPYSNRWLRALARRGLIPSFISKKRRVELSNLFSCEAHRDRIMEYLLPGKDLEI